MILAYPWEALFDGGQWKVRAIHPDAQGHQLGAFCAIAFTSGEAQQIAEEIAASHNASIPKP